MKKINLILYYFIFFLFIPCKGENWIIESGKVGDLKIGMSIDKLYLN